MDRLLRWKHQTPWYYRYSNKTLKLKFSSQQSQLVETPNTHNKIKEPVKPVEPEWKKDEKEILKGDQYSSYSYGGGRFGNQIIRNLAMSLIAEKFDLIMRYQRSDEIEKLGFKLFSGKKNIENIK